MSLAYLLQEHNKQFNIQIEERANQLINLFEDNFLENIELLEDARTKATILNIWKTTKKNTKISLTSSTELPNRYKKKPRSVQNIKFSERLYHNRLPSKHNYTDIVESSESESENDGDSNSESDSVNDSVNNDKVAIMGNIKMDNTINTTNNILLPSKRKYTEVKIAPTRLSQIYLDSNDNISENAKDIGYYLDTVTKFVFKDNIAIGELNINKLERFKE